MYRNFVILTLNLLPLVIGWSYGELPSNTDYKMIEKRGYSYSMIINHKCHQPEHDFTLLENVDLYIPEILVKVNKDKNFVNIKSNYWFDNKLICDMYHLVEKLNVNYQEIKLMELKNDNLIAYLEIDMNNYDVAQINRMDNIYVQYYDN